MGRREEEKREERREQREKRRQDRRREERGWYVDAGFRVTAHGPARRPAESGGSA